MAVPESGDQLIGGRPCTSTPEPFQWNDTVVEVPSGQALQLPGVL
nr:hypothetical protein [Nocardia nova]